MAKPINTGIKLSAYDRTGGSKKGSSSSKKPGLQVDTSSASTSRGSGSSGGSSGSRRPGSTYRQGGKTYIVNTNGMSVDVNSDAGRRVQSKFSGGGSSGGSTGSRRPGGLQVQTSGAYDPVGNMGGGSRGGLDASNPYGLDIDTKAELYTGRGDYKDEKEYRTKAVARMKSGVAVAQKYVDEHPDKVFFTLDSTPQIRSVGMIGGVPRYQGGVNYGKTFNGKPVGVVGSNGVIYYPDNFDVPVAAWAANQAAQDYNHGTNGGDADLLRQNMPDVYYQVYGDYASGRGRNGKGLPSGSDAYQQIWGGGGFDQEAYDRLVAQGLVAPPRDYWADAAANAAYAASPGAMAAELGGYSHMTQKPIPNTGRSSRYEEAMEAALDAAEANARAAQRQYTDQIPGVNQSADDAARQAYIAMQQAGTALPQQMSAMGFGGGLTESSLMGLQTGYENNRNSILRDRDNAIRQLQNQAAYAGAQGDANASSIQAQYLAQMAQMEEAARQQAAQMAWEAQQQERNRQWQAQQAAQDFQWQKELAGYKAGLGGGGGSGTSYFSYLKSINDNAYDMGDIDYATYVRNGSMIAQGQNPFPDTTDNGAGPSFPPTQMTPEKIVELYSSGKLTKEEARRHAQNLGLSIQF